MFEVLKYKLLHPVVQKLDSTIRRISHYPVDKYKENQLLFHLPLERPGPGLRGLFVKLLHLWTKSYGGKKNAFSVSDTSDLEEKSEFSQSRVEPMAFQLLVQLRWITLSIR